MKLSQWRLRFLVLVGWVVLVGVFSVGGQERDRLGNVLAASSPWVQTDWSGGQSNLIATGAGNTYLSKSGVNTNIADSISISQTAGWAVDMSDWSRRKTITVTNTLGAQTNYQVKVAVTYDTDMQPDFDDLRFTNSVGTNLDYWLESKIDSTSAIVWVEVDNLSGSGDTSLYMYYGNGGVSGASNGFNTFSFFDDFNDNSFDLTKWVEVDPRSKMTESNNKLSFTYGSGSGNWDTAIYSIAGFTRADRALEYDLRWSSDYSPYDAFMFGWKDDGSGASYTNLVYGYYNQGDGFCTTNCIGPLYEDGNGRGNLSGTWSKDVDYKIRLRMRQSGGAYYEKSVNGGASYVTDYTSSYSSESNLHIAWMLYSGDYTIDNVRVRNWLSTEPSVSFMSEELKYPTSATLESNILDSGVAMDWGLLSYIKSGSGTVTVKVRTDNTDNMSGATTWGSCSAVASGTDISANNCVDDSDRYIQYQINLQPSGSSTPVFEEISIAFIPSDQLPPEVNATDISISGLAESGDWYKDEAVIGWSLGKDIEDGEAGNGILGYCISLDEADQDSSHGLDPQNDAGILQGKNDGVTQSYCPYITIGEEFNIGNVGSLDLTSGKEYFFSLKAVDLAGNIYTGSDNTWKDVISFKYDNEEPTPPFYISLPANFLSSKDVVITWPVGVGGADDIHSGLAGLQYRIGDSGTWYGDLHTGTEDINDLLINDGSYVTDGNYDYPILEEGNNLIYFRAVDNLGNMTAPEDYVKGLIKLNTIAPSPIRNLTVSPLDSEENAYSFNWDAPAIFTGSESGLTYCYAINTIPSASTCTFTQAGATELAADAFATQPGTNTMYVVAKDEAGNINYATYSEPGASVSFVYSGTAPGIPQNLDVADISVKATNNWRLVLSWDKPTSVGAGISYYNIYRSATNTSCSGGLTGFAKVGSSSSTSYIDPDLKQQNYNYCVKACDSANNCSASSGTVGKLPTGKFTEPAEILSAPEVVSFTTRKAVISWVTDRVSDSSIQYGLESEKYFEEEISNSMQIANHNITLNNLQPGTTYYYRAKWTDVDGNTGVSEEKTFATLPPPTIANVTANSITTNAAIIKFKVRNATRTAVVYGTTESYGGREEIATSIEESEYFIGLDGLADGVTYNYKFFLEDVDGNMNDSIVNFQFTTLPYPEINNFRFEEVKNSAQPTVKIFWETNVETIGLAEFAPQSDPEQKRNQSEREYGTEHQMDLISLSANTQYNLNLVVTDRLGNNETSEVISFNTAKDARPPKISNLKIETRANETSSSFGDEAFSQIVVTWDTDELATSQVQYNQGTTGEYTQKTSLDENLGFNHIVVINNLQPSSVYRLQVLSRDGSGNEALGKNVVTITAQAQENPLEIILTRLGEVFSFIM